MERECLERAKEMLDQVDSTDLRVILVHILREIQKDIDLYRVLFLRRNDVHILEQYLAMSLEKTENILKERALQGSDIQARWASRYGGYGCMGVIQCWIGDGMRQSPEEVADFIVESLTKTMDRAAGAAESGRSCGGPDACGCRILPQGAVGEPLYSRMKIKRITPSFGRPAAGSKPAQAKPKGGVSVFLLPLCGE